MSLNLLESAKGLFTNEIIAKTVRNYDESDENIQKAISAIVPSVLTGFMHKASSLKGVGEIFLFAQNAAAKKFNTSFGKMLEKPTDSKYAKGVEISDYIFDGKLSDVAHSVSLFSGVKETTATVLLKTATPATLGLIGQSISKDKLNYADVAHIIGEQKDSILNDHPYGFNLSSILGVNHIWEVGYKFGDVLKELPEKTVTAVSEKIESIKPIKEKTKISMGKNWNLTHKFWVILSWVLIVVFVILLIILVASLPVGFKI